MGIGRLAEQVSRVLTRWSRPHRRRTVEPDEPPSLRNALFGPDQLASHAVSLAAAHHARVRRAPEKLLSALDENERVIRESFECVAAAARRGAQVAPAGEWLLDNYYLIEEQIALARKHLPRRYSRELPRLVGGPLEDFPCVYSLALALVSHTDGRVDLENLTHFVRSYQSTRPLTLGELWAVPIMLRLTLLDNLARVSHRIAWRRRQRDLALAWAGRFMDVARRRPKLFVTALADFVRSEPTLSTPFIAELTASLECVQPSLQLVINWIEQELSERAQSVELIQQAESQDQATDQVSMGNSITSLRTLSAVDWRLFIESLSATEEALRGDPAQAYARMDFHSRDGYRHAVEDLSKGSGRTEPEAAEAAVEMAETARAEAGRLPREAHVGYYLVDDGRPALEARLAYKAPLRRRVTRWVARHPAAWYFSAVILALVATVAPLMTLAATLWPWPRPWLAGVTLLLLMAASRPAIGLVNLLATLVAPPRRLPRMDFADGLPKGSETAVVIPTLLNGSTDAVEDLLEHLEICYLANRQKGLRFGLLTDFADAPEEHRPEEEPVLNAAREGIRRMNAQYAPSGGTVFFLLHRPRTWNPAERQWMGYERKRGKLDQFNRLALEGDTQNFSAIEGDLQTLRRTRYVITLDRDTELPMGAACAMAGALAHPLNRPVLDPKTRTVRLGYGILQPRLAVQLVASRRSRYARLFSGEVGIDPYTREVSNVFQDVFGRGQFVGKGAYDLRAFQESLGETFPKNRILSHDLIEGCYARCGFLSDVSLIEEQPAAYLSDAERRHRWARGDWQIASWLLPRVPTAQGWTANPLDRLSRWLIFDNLRRNLAPAALLGTLLLGWAGLPGVEPEWTATVLTIWFLPEIARALRTLLDKPREASWKAHGGNALGQVGRSGAMALLDLMCLPFDTALHLDAAVRACWRLMVSRRRLLEWRTAEDTAHAARNGLGGVAARMWTAPTVALAGAGAAWMTQPRPPIAACVVAALWAGSPWAAWFLSRPALPRRGLLGVDEIDFLRRLARRTWSYFERFVTADRHGLPPDNYQEAPTARAAGYTSPTNIGLALLSNLAAYDFGYVSAGRLLERTEMTLATVEDLDRYAGNLYNWYSIESRETLHPLYISSVDSGNLAGMLVALRHGLLELGARPILPERWREGLEDTVAVLRETADRAPAEAAALREARGIVTNRLAELAKARQRLPAIVQGLQKLCADLPAAGQPAQVDSEAAEWLAALCAQAEDLLAELARLTPWALDVELVSRAATALDAPALRELLRVPTPGDLLDLEERLAGALEKWRRDAPEDKPIQERLAGHLAAGARAAEERIRRLEEAAARCADLGEFGMDFLYDPTTRLMSIGYNRDTHRRDPGNYDLLASEARLSSFLGVARGVLPMEHWFSLGRQLAPGSGPPVLVSWSGSLFEYLMPLLVMPSFEATLLHESCRAAVARQQRYARANGIPWGISESCYNQVDAQRNYQYRAFGVPSLGLKRGLTDDLVVAPYASALALMVSPRAACANLRNMAAQGFLGRHGMYEAVDYTARRVPMGEKFAIVRSYMAHHSGMSFVALCNALLGNPMHRRFLSDPQVRSAALLLHERVPLARAHLRSSAAIAESPERARPEAAPSATRTFSTPHTDCPETHLLSNGRYNVMVTNSGGGYSHWKDLALTRWREDTTRDSRGFFFYLRDVHSGVVWSAAGQPVVRPFDQYEVTYSQGIAAFRTVMERVEVYTQIAVSPEDDVELRRMVITNLAGREREVELTSYGEVVLAPPAAERSHPAFNGLFVETELKPDHDAILCRRRPRSSEETWPWLFHTLAVRGQEAQEPASFETDRRRFLGRGRTAAMPKAVEQGGPLSNTSGAVLDPAVAIRRRLVLKPGHPVTVDSFLGVGTDRANADLLIDKCRDPRLAERLFELAWTHSQVLLHQVRTTEPNAQLFAALAGSLLYANWRYRASPGVIVRNSKGQNGLWTYGVSGELPIVLLRLTDVSDLELARQLIQAHAYWRLKGLRTELVIWAEAVAGYRRSLHDAVVGLVNAGSETRVLDQPGGIFVRDIQQVAEEDRALVQSAARLVLSDRFGSLGEQLRRRARWRVPVADLRPTREPEPPLPGEMELPDRDLRLFNGTGGFTPDGREYVILLRAGQPTPAPWANVLANARFGAVVTEAGSAYSWCENAHEFRLTPWRNDPVSDLTGEALYLRDEETGRYWSLTSQPTPGPTPYVCRHGLGYSAFEHTQDGLFSETTFYVDKEQPVKFMVIKVRNLSGRARRLSATCFCEWVLGESREKHSMHVITRMDVQSGALLAWNPFNSEFPGRVAFLHCSSPERTVTGDRTEFLGRNGSPAAPEALRREGLSNRVGAAMDPCGAVQARLDLPPGEERQMVFVLGAAVGEQEARNLARHCADVSTARHALEQVWEFWKHRLGGVYVETPDPAVNFLAGHWLLYQSLTSRFWGRSGYYQSGGAYGFRDQLQDGLSFLHECPGLAREQLLRCAGRQFIEGDVQHWWHPPSGRGVRTRISDDVLWLPYVACRYVRTTGDTGALDETRPWLEGRPLAEGEESYYDQPQISEQTASLYAHCVRAIRHSLRFGSHGLPLMGSGDWNDGMNRVGIEGRGESVWLAFFQTHVLRLFADLAETRGDAEFARECRDQADAVAARLEEHAWDGQWYLRAFFDDGSPLGSLRSQECRIDSIAQSWAVLSSTAPAGRAAQAMDSVHERLVDPELRLIRLFDPPFDATRRDPGYIKGYVPGVRENGGQYTHAAVWAAMAFARLRQADRAWEAFQFINPVRHGDTAEKIERYMVEPYVAAADIYTAEGHAGRGGWTWYTGSAGWMYQLIVEHLLGLRLEIDRLCFEPLMPKDWKEFTVHYRFRRSMYHIRVLRTGEETWKVRRVEVDGREEPDRTIHLVDDAREHTAIVEAGE